MTTLREVLLYLVRRRPGITDRQLTEAIYGSDERHQQVNAECRACAEIERRQGAIHIGNFVRDDDDQSSAILQREAMPAK